MKGNNVTKIFVVNSAGGFSAVRPSLKVTPGNLIIASEPNIDGCISIPTIPGYSSMTDSAKISKYMKANSNDKSIISTILTAARVSMEAHGGV